MNNFVFAQLMRLMHIAMLPSLSLIYPFFDIDHRLKVIRKQEEVKKICKA